LNSFSIAVTYNYDYISYILTIIFVCTHSIHTWYNYIRNKSCWYKWQSCVYLLKY